MNQILPNKPSATGSRIEKTTRNFIVGIIYQILLLLLNFISRTIFIKVLGVEYLGINGLFANILSVLSMADLGIGTAIMYSLYKPLARKDKTIIAALISYYKKIYIVIASAVAIIGISLVPFLQYIVNLDKSLPNIKIYYILFLLNSVVSYLFVYKTILISADQKNYLLKIYNMAFAVIKFVAQIFVLYATHNYILFLVIMVLSTLSNNYFCSIKTEKIYPYLKLLKTELDKTYKKTVFVNIKSVFLYRFGGIILNNTDNIIISILVGTVAVGYYSNYFLLITAILGFTNIIISSVMASVGNLVVDNNLEYKYKIFNILSLLCFWVFGFSSICLFILFQDFISLWLGSDYLLSNIAVIIIIINFYMPGLLNPIWIFRDTTGLFKKTKYITIVTSIINIVLSVLLGMRYGLTGVLGATILARGMTNFWYEPYILHKDYFRKPVVKYFLQLLIRTILLCATAGLLYYITNFFNISSVQNFIIKLFLCIIVINGIFFIVFRKMDEFIYLKEYFLKSIIRNLKTKIMKK